MKKKNNNYVENIKLKSLLQLIYSNNDEDALNEFMIEAQKLGYKRVYKDKEIRNLDMVDDVVAYASISLFKAIQKQKFNLDGNLVSSIMQHFNFRLIDFKIKNNRQIVRIEIPKHYDDIRTYIEPED